MRTNTDVIEHSNVHANKVLELLPKTTKTVERTANTNTLQLLLAIMHRIHMPTGSRTIQHLEYPAHTG